jgi:hypothetical protein
MGLKVGDTVTISLLATLAGAAAAYEGAPTIVVEPAGLVSDITIAGDNLSGTATVLAAGAFTVTATVDNLQGDPVGALVGTVSGEFLAADPVVLADQLDVTVS